MIHLADLKSVQALVGAELFRHKHLMVMLPRQEGKTELGIRLIHDLIKYPQTHTALFLAKSRDAAQKITREKFKRIFDENKFHVNTQNIYNRAFETAICFIDSVDKRPDKLRGGTYHLIHWSEVAFSEFDHGVTLQDVYNKVLKPTQRQTDGYLYLESTPNGKGSWYDMWEDKDTYSSFKRIKISLSKMVELGLVTMDEYIKIRDETPALVFQQEYECEFVTFAGRTYEEMQAHHIWKDMPGPEPWQEVVMAIDWGWSPSATCVLFGYVLDGRFCVFDEIYGMEILLEDLRDLIRAKLAYWNVGSFSLVADHDSARNEELKRLGIPTSKANKVDVLGARMAIKTAFKQNKMYIHPRCGMLHKDLANAEWDPKKHGDINYKKCSWGHFDGESTLRYLYRELGKFERQE